MNDTRERIVAATAELFRLHGYTGTGLKQISTDSGAPFGSVYHFFPGGKEELAAAALRAAGTMYQQRVAEVMLQATDPVSAMTLLYDKAAETLRQTDYADACPIATVALEVASTNDALRQVTAEIFAGWIDGLVAWFEWAGLDAAKSRELAITVIAALEGAFVLSRAAKNTEALAAVGAVMRDVVRRALDDAGATTAAASTGASRARGSGAARTRRPPQKRGH